MYFQALPAVCAAFCVVMVTLIVVKFRRGRGLSDPENIEMRDF